MQDNTNVDYTTSKAKWGSYIGAALDVLRVYSKITQAELARRASELLKEKVDQGYVCQIENGVSQISWQRFVVFCSVLGFSPSEVVALAETMQSDRNQADKDVFTDLRNRLNSVFGARLPPPKEPDSLTTSRLVCLREVGSLLRSFREFQKLSEMDVLSAIQDDEVCPWRTLTCIQSLERGEIPGPAKLLDVYSLARAYRMPMLMLDSLISEATSDPIVCESLLNFQCIGGIGNSSGYGANTTYNVPSKRLSDSSAAVVYLTLEARNGISDKHTHPGDEIVFVVEGSVDIVIDSLGLRETLTRGDAIHFNAEHLHWIENPGTQRASVIVVRFYHLAEDGSRDAVERLRSALSTNSTSLSLGDRDMRGLIAELTEMALGSTCAKGIIRNPVALGRFLRGLLRSQSRTIDAACLRAVEVGWPRSPEEVRGVFYGRELSSSSQDDLMFLAKVANTSHVLLSSFIAPPVPNCAVIRRSCDLLRIEGQKEVSGVADYFIPRRTLAFSRVTIAYLSLSPNEGSPWNAHPGTELIFPLDNEVTVEMETGIKQRIVSNKFEFAHFVSGLEHRVVNSGLAPVQCLVIRMHYCDSVDLQEVSDESSEDGSDRSFQAKLAVRVRRNSAKASMTEPGENA